MVTVTSMPAPVIPSRGVAAPRDGTAGLRPETLAVLAAVAPWWQTRAESAGLTGAWLDVRHALVAQAPGELDGLAPSPSIGDATDGHDLGRAYVESLSDVTRSAHGRHYTPAVLAGRLWEMARAGLNWNSELHQITGLVRDPACGAGALLIPVIREHLRASTHIDPSLVIAALGSRIEAIDQDEWAVWLTNVVLATEALPLIAKIPASIRRPFPAVATVGDGLADRLPKAMVTLMNPPYGRLKLSDSDRARFGDVLYGHANLYGLFMAAGARNLADDGVLAALVPTSFSSGLYFHKLREFLSERAPLSSVTFVNDRSGVFAGVLQETCLAVFTRKRGRSVEITRSNGHLTHVAKVPTPSRSDPWLLPRESVDAALAAAASKLPLTLRDAGWHASTGPLVWNRRRDDLFTRPGTNRAYVLWGADIDGGEIHRDKGRDSMRWMKLRDDRDRATNLLDGPAVLVQRTTSPEQSRRLVAVDLSPEVLNELGGAVVVENHVNVLRPTALLPLLSRETLARVLATQTLDRLMRCISGSVAVSSYELAALPLPDAATLDSWEGLTGMELERAVAAAYRGKAS